jgi:uncharacterized protein YqhQ
MSKNNTSPSGEKFKSKIGGQALIEGIMMLGPERVQWLADFPTVQLIWRYGTKITAKMPRGTEKLPLSVAVSTL